MPELPSAAHRQLGSSGLFVSPVALGTWPISGVNSSDVNDADSIALLRSCADLGVNFIDTAYCYGSQGESENLIRRAIGPQREAYVIASKCGIHYNTAGQQAQDGRPETILRECDESLRRLGTDRIDLYYLHSPDPAVPVAESAGAISELIATGKVLTAGLSNGQLPDIEAFHAACPLTAVQLPYNLLQRDIEQLTVPWCQTHGVAVIVYWALMKGLLAGQISRERPLSPGDTRLKYPMYQGEEWEKNLQFVDRLRAVAEDAGKTVSQVVVNWTIRQPGIAAALCGAKRPDQFTEVAGAMGWELSVSQQSMIDAALAQRGHAAAKRVFR